MEKYFVFLLLIFSSCTNRDEKSMDSSIRVEPAKEMSYEIRDDSGKVWKILEKLVLNDGFSKRIYRYDEMGKEIEEALYYMNDNLAYKIINSYDTAGREVEKKFYDCNGNLEYNTIYKYDNNGYKIEMSLSQYNTGKRPTPVWVVRYYDRGLRFRKPELYYSDGKSKNIDTHDNRSEEAIKIRDSIYRSMYTFEGYHKNEKTACTGYAIWFLVDKYNRKGILIDRNYSFFDVEGELRHKFVEKNGVEKHIYKSNKAQNGN